MPPGPQKSLSVGRLVDTSTPIEISALPSKVQAACQSPLAICASGLPFATDFCHLPNKKTARKRGQARLLLTFNRFALRLCVTPRAPRAVVGGICYHVKNRGNGRRTGFHEVPNNDFGPAPDFGTTKRGGPPA